VEDSESEEIGGREVQYLTSTCMRKDDSGLEDELKYFWEAPIPSDSNEREEDRWWSPGPQEPSSEEDEEEVRYLYYYSTTSTYLGSCPRKMRSRMGSLHPSPRARQVPAGAAVQPRQGDLRRRKKDHQSLPRAWSPPPCEEAQEEGT
jgi:hypothetical protein